MERDRRATSVGVGPGPDPRGGDLWCVSTVGEKVRGSPAAAPSFHPRPSPFIPFHLLPPPSIPSDGLAVLWRRVP